MARPDIRRGQFKIIGAGAGNQLVAVEVGWEADQAKLEKQLEDYAIYLEASVGVHSLKPGKVYACVDDKTREWRRCRRVNNAGSRAVRVELIDNGRQQTVRPEEVMPLSSLYQDWMVKAVDLHLDGLAVAVDSKDFGGMMRKYFFNKTFEIRYEYQRRGLLIRDQLRVSGLTLNGLDVVEDLLDKGILRRC